MPEMFAATEGTNCTAYFDGPTLQGALLAWRQADSIPLCPCALPGIIEYAIFTAATARLSALAKRIVAWRRLTAINAQIQPHLRPDQAFDNIFVT